MDNASLLGHSSAKIVPDGPPPSATAVNSARDVLRFPTEDGGKSLTEMAEQDLQAALQLLAERAQYITGASGAAIALRDGREMVCRASTGASAPEVGAALQVNSGLTGESVRQKMVLRCDDAEKDPRVNRDSCRALGIKSVMVMPLVRDDEVIGVFELLADRERAFEERDVIALERLSEMILIALEHADAARRASAEIAAGNEAAPESAASSPAEPAPTLAQKAQPESKVEGTPEPAASDLSKIRPCEACGFPVSEGRKLCLDCEAARADAGASSNDDDGFLSQMIAEGRNETWLDRHLYTIGTVVMVALTVIVILLKFR